MIVYGCMVGPEFKRPVTLAETAEKYVYADKAFGDANEAGGVGRWWERFCDDKTSELVHLALSNNNDLQAAAARALQAEALLAEAGGKLLPEVSYNFNRSRSKSSFDFGGGRFSNTSTTFSQDFSVSYVADLFGKLRHQERAAWADLLAAKASEEALIHAIIGNVVKARVEIATIQRSLRIARSNTGNWEKSLEIIERRYSRGLTGPVDVRLARENLEASKAAEILIELSLAKAENSLDVLLGRAPGSGGAPGQSMPELPNLAPLPVGLPAWLLDRRPDVRAAEFALESSNEQIGISIAQLYPGVTLSAAAGRTSDRWRDIWKDETEIYSAVFRIAQPIFRGGQLRARVKAARAKYSELAANYAETVLKAMQEVEDALAEEKFLQRRLKALQLRLDEAIEAEKLANDRYTRGVEKLIVVLETERNVKGRLWTGRVNLFLALGGDWEVERPVSNNKG
jgi:NodT family efflux transporter outer membrane factor (OMF) lipoprotein